MSNNVPLIAVVDDDESMRKAITGLMRSVGLAVEAFPSGEDFIRSQRADHAACLITDVNMPGMSGLDLHRILIQSGIKIPTILVTAYPSEAVRSRALSAGVLCYLTKPLQEQDLITCINSALQAHDST